MINSAPASRLLAHRVLSLSFITAVVVTLVGCSQEQENNQSQPQMPPPAVEVVTLSSERLELVDTLPGRVSAYRTAEIRPQVSGIILKRFFEEGATVKKGDKLYQIDPTLYASELASAEAQLAVANANAYSAKLRDERYQKLSQSAISAQEITDADAAAKQTAAQVKAAEANVQRAKVNLGYTKITAPIDGVIGRSTITEGALVSAQQALPLTMIQQLSPIYVDIKRPAAALLRMGEAGLSNKVKVSLDDGTEFDEVGERQFSDAMVDEGTGTVNLRVLFENKEKRLLPGMFVRADVPSTLIKDAILVPQRAVVRQATGTTSTFVVGEDNVIESRNIQVTRAIGDQWLLKTGLESGERVVISGLQKIKPGAKVAPEEASSSDTKTAGKETSGSNSSAPNPSKTATSGQ